MSKFYQPYQFLPVKTLSENKKLDYQDIKNNISQHPARHDLWQSLRSGRILCTITMETPVLIGLEHQETKGKPPNKLIQPQQRKFGDKDAYYIPGNTLRGLISSIAEAITQSSLRVLEDTKLKISFGPKKSRPLGSVHEHFETISSDLLPLGSDLRKSNNLTPAELLFGCIEMQNNNKTEAAFALASRLRFSDAKMTDGKDQPLMDAIILKVLATPKTNSHNLYHHLKEDHGEFIEKGELNTRDHSPNGRKFYLHATSSMVTDEAWKTDTIDTAKPKLHVKARPFKANQAFTFHVDFENLSEPELGMLVTSLRPDKDFRHKLGMGKPLGLGTVRLDIENIYFIDRKQRYGHEALKQQRYSEVMQHSHSHSHSHSQANLKEKSNYQQEQKASNSFARQTLSINDELIDKDSLAILLRMGQWPYTHEEDNFPIDYPYMENQKGEVTGTGFEWFVQNERVGSQQTLGKIEPSQPLPTLERYKKQEK